MDMNIFNSTEYTVRRFSTLYNWKFSSNGYVTKLGGMESSPYSTLVVL